MEGVRRQLISILQLHAPSAVTSSAASALDTSMRGDSFRGEGQEGLQTRCTAMYCITPVLIFVRYLIIVGYRTIHASYRVAKIFLCFCLFYVYAQTDRLNRIVRIRVLLVVRLVVCVVRTLHY